MAIIDPYCRTGLAHILFHRSAAKGDATDREEARSLFEEAAALNNPYARRRLDDFDERWHRFAAHGLSAAAEKGDSEPTFELTTPTPDQMRPAQRLGMALVRQWQATQCADLDQANRRGDHPVARQVDATAVVPVHGRHAAAGEGPIERLLRGFAFHRRDVPGARRTRTRKRPKPVTRLSSELAASIGAGNRTLAPAAAAADNVR